jgi:hypothetical protein
MTTKKTSLTFYVTQELKQRIAAAALAEQRSTSQYLVIRLERLIPRIDTKAAQIDIEEQIASKKKAPRRAK